MDEERLIQKLDRHQQRRASGVPTLSVLVGPPERSAALWRGWASASGRRWIRVHPAGSRPVHDVAREWVSRPWVLKRLVRFLAPDMEMASRRMYDVLTGEPCQERSQVVERMLSVSASRSMETLCRRVLLSARAVGPGPLEDRSASLLVEALSRVEGARAPGLLLLGFEAAERTAADLAALVEICPGVPAGWAVSETAFSALMASMPPSRAASVCREGVVVSDERFARSAPMKVPCGAETCVEVFREAASLTWKDEETAEASSDSIPARPPAGEPSGEEGEAEEEARSAAEAFLFQQLESRPETAGLFELNGTLPAPWGPHRRVEVDLLCRSRRVAVEIDGYHHFCSPDGYRRDRQKDLLLQRQGFLVLRFLADDVVSGLETILETILTSLAWCEGRDI